MVLFKPWQRILFVALSLMAIIFSVPEDRDLGMYFFNSYEYERAIPYLIQSELNSSGDVFVLKKLKDFSLIQGDVQNAYETQLKLISLRPKNIEYLMEAEKLATWTQRFEESLALREKRAYLEGELDPKKEEYNLLGVAKGYRFHKNFKEADRLYLKLGSSKSKQIVEESIRYFLARKDATTAEKLLREYTKNHKESLEMFNFYYQTLAYQGDYDDASRVILAKIEPKLDWSLRDESNLVQNISSLKKEKVQFFSSEVEVLIPLLEKSISKNGFAKASRELLSKVKNPGMAHIDLGNYFLAEGKKNSALGYFKIAENLYQGSFREVNFELASAYGQINLWNDAIRCLERLTDRYYKNRVYWRLLGEAYENNGEKKKAVKAFLKLYRLEKGKIEQSYNYLINVGPRFAQVSNGFPLALPKRPIISTQSKKLFSIEQRIVDSIYGYENMDSRIEGFDELLAENPTSILALKGKAYTLFELGRANEAYSIFEELYLLYPNDKEVNQVLVSKWIESEENDKIEKYAALLKEDYNSNVIRHVLRDYYWRTKPQVYKEYCQSKISESLPSDFSGDRNFEVAASSIDCSLRNGESEKALTQAKEFHEKYPTSCKAQSLRVYLEIEVGDLDWAYRKIQGDNNCFSFAQKVEISELFLGQNHLRRGGRFWRWEQGLSYLITNNFSFLEVEEALTRKLDKWSLGFRGNLTKVTEGGSSTFSFGALEFKWFAQNGSVFTFAPTFLMGDKESRMGFMAGYSLNIRNLFLNLEFTSNRPLQFTQELALEESAYASRGELYLNYRSQNRDWNLLGFGLVQKIYFQNQSSLGSQLTFEALRRIYTDNKKQLFDFYSGLQLSTSGLSSSEGPISRNFLRKSTAYHLVMKAEYNYPDNYFPDTWSGSFRLGVGGDQAREIDFFDSIQVTGVVNRSLGKRSKISLTGEYYSEFLGINRGDTRIIRLDFVKDFW